jgi:MFS family permease
VSTLQITLLQKWLSPEEFQAWGWRVPFWISLLLLLAGLYIRKSIEETPVFLELSKNSGQLKSPLLNNLRDSETRKKMLILFFCISASGAILFFCVQVYAGIFLKTSAQLSIQVVDQLGICATIALFPLTIFTGWLSDKIGRKPVIVSGLLLGGLFIIPAFEALQILGSEISTNNSSSLIYITIILVGLSSILALVVGPQTALLAELFPARRRNSAATLPHNLAAGWIGGLLPLIVTWLNQLSENHLLGLWYPVILLLCASFIAILYLPETFNTDLLK